MSTRTTQVVIEGLVKNTSSNFRVTQDVIELLMKMSPNIRGTQVVLEVLCPAVAEEEDIFGPKIQMMF